jgi:hypothetical protein
MPRQILFNLQMFTPSNYGGKAPFRVRPLPLLGITPFGKTDSDIKQPRIPIPLLFKLKGKNRISYPKSFVPMPAVYLRIFGITKDSAGAVLASCTVNLLETLANKFIESTISDANGNYEFRSPSLSTAYYVVAYKAGSPDVAGTTVNTLTGI